ncbi:two-component system, chemotaxis family, sensor histidine kinase and response regulator WspE [Candidatus Magnetomoraceae bacterium gMMP-15]
MNEEELLKKLRKAFKMEAEERVSSISSGLLELEEIDENPERQQVILEEIFREAHSIKGAARAVNYMDIETLCQSVENIFSALKQNKITLSQAVFDTLYSSLEIIEKLLEGTKKEYNRDISIVLRELEDLKHSEVKETDINPESLEQLAESEQETVFKEPLEKPTESEQEIVFKEPLEEVIKPAQEPVFKEPLEKLTEKASPSSDFLTKPVITDTVRIPVAKLDSLLLKAEEMVSLKLAAGQRIVHLKETIHSFELWKKQWAAVEFEFRWLRHQVQKGKQSKQKNFSQLAGLESFLEWNQSHIKFLEHEIKSLTSAGERDQRSLSSMIDDVLEDMKKVTMLPFSTLSDILRKMVRDLARDQNKKINLVINGNEIEIDRRILEKMKDPFIHILRNAIDHGLEDADTRRHLNKPEKGTITLSIFQVSGNKVEIIISDDGRGMQLTTIKDAAVKRKIIHKKEAEQLKEKDILSLIFRSELSTSSIITQISGRGLGLAIVKEKVQQLGGFLEVETSPGQGSSFRMQLPVTLATFRGILIRVNDSFFVVPVSHVERVLRIKCDDIQTVENKATIPLDDVLVSFVHLSDILKLSPLKKAEKTTNFITVILLEVAGNRIAFKVDEVLGEQEVLVKGLGRQLSRVRNISGATILGSGKVVPILNVPDLIKSSSKNIISSHEISIKEEEREDRVKSILVVEDSITSRMLIKSILESAGYFVKTSVNGLDAYENFKTQNFDLVVSDIEMPKMNGFELTKKIRGNKKIGDTPVVLVTSLESPEDRKKGIDAGANAYIIKSSFDQSNLIEIIERLI